MKAIRTGYTTRFVVKTNKLVGKPYSKKPLRNIAADRKTI
jgi:hypothetical protein